MVVVSMSFIASLAQDAQIVQVDRVARPIDRDQDGQADRGLDRRHGDDEERDHLPVEVAPPARRGHEREVDRVQLHLERHEDGEGVPPREKSEPAEEEEDGGEPEIVPQRDLTVHDHSPFFATTTAPTIPTKRMREMTSKGRRYRVKS